MRSKIIILSGVALCAALLIPIADHTRYAAPLQQLTTAPAREAQNPEGSILFLGDIMLARHVEVLMQRHSFDYPFQHFAALRGSSSHIVANFESSVPEVHQPTPSMTFRFSVIPEALNALRDAGVTHVSLANNHALDHGPAVLQHTEAALAEAAIRSFGHPTRVASSSVDILSLGATRVGIIGLHTLFAPIDQVNLQQALEELEAVSDIQVAYVHWGDEYELSHNEAQAQLARELVAGGIDLIVGHHPHVIQDIGRIGNVPVIYSLGNAIFDQYWKRDVQDGLAIRLALTNEDLVLDLLPLSSTSTPSAPYVLAGAAKNEVLTALAARSDPSFAEGIKAGRIRLPHGLDFSQKISTILPYVE